MMMKNNMRFGITSLLCGFFATMGVLNKLMYPVGDSVFPAACVIASALFAIASALEPEQHSAQKAPSTANSTAQDNSHVQ